MNKTRHDILLADDDMDDCTFFEDALKELPVTVSLSIVNDGVQLINFLSASENLPGLLFLDLNMPRKSGMECLSEIKANDKFKALPVIIFSTSLNIDVLDALYQKGAHYYVRKPGEYQTLKKVILEAISLTAQNSLDQPARDQFIIHP